LRMNCHGDLVKTSYTHQIKDVTLYGDAIFKKCALTTTIKATLRHGGKADVLAIPTGLLWSAAYCSENPMAEVMPIVARTLAENPGNVGTQRMVGAVAKDNFYDSMIVDGRNAKCVPMEIGNKRVVGIASEKGKKDLHRNCTYTFQSMQRRACGYTEPVIELFVDPADIHKDSDAYPGIERARMKANGGIGGGNMKVHVMTNEELYGHEDVTILASARRPAAKRARVGPP